jgi:hypothetical protein
MTSTSGMITLPAETSALPTPLKSSGISVGAKVGLGIGSTAVSVAILVLLFLAIKRHTPSQQLLTLDGKQVEATAKQILGFDNATYLGSSANQPGE